MRMSNVSIKKVLVVLLVMRWNGCAEGVHQNAVCIDGKYENHVFMALLYV